MTDKALLEGAEEERVEVEDREQDPEEGGWAVQDRAPARPVSVCAHNAALRPPIKSGHPAIRYSALSVALQWSENK
ncbi:MAG: hypothetical protein JXA50_11280 [Deltaproteobacteria bacterium]|nr:hypothetical protein [Deltaproteobacteria bacterium]